MRAYTSKDFARLHSKRNRNHDPSRKTISYGAQATREDPGALSLDPELNAHTDAVAV